MKKVLFALLVTMSSAAFCAQVADVRAIVNELKATGATREVLINRVQDSCKAGDITSAEAEELLAEISTQSAQ